MLVASSLTASFAASYPAPVGVGAGVISTCAIPLGYISDATPGPVIRPSISMSPTDAKLIRHWRRDFRAGLADVFGLKVLSPDQEAQVAALQAHRRVAAMGGTGTGKSFVQGNVARLVSMLWPSKMLFGGPRESQAKLLSWLEYQRAHDKAVERGINPGGKMQTTDWQGPQRDWFAVLMALSDRANAAGVKGMLHAGRVAVVLDELEGVAPECRDALMAGTAQDNAHYWFAFNPVNLNDAAGQFWQGTPEAARVRLSSLACAEWQERTGNRIPGMPSLAAIDEVWHGKENEPLYYTNVLGEFPPESASWVVVPKDWFNKCVGVVPVGIQSVGIGVDTAGGRAENVIAVVEHGRVRVAWANRELHQTPRLVTEVKRIAEPYGRSVPIAVDVIGQGGKGVADQLRADGYNALDFVGGGREFAGVAASDASMDLYADRATWAWFQIRVAVQATAEGSPSIQLPNDSVLRDQGARRYGVTGERRYKLESKDSANSPDRFDAVAMAWAAATSGRGRLRYETPAAGESRGYRSERSERPDSYADRKAQDPAMA